MSTPPTVQVTLEFFHLPEFGGGKHVELCEYPRGTTVHDVFVQYGFKGRGLIALVNGRHAGSERQLTDGDRLSVLYQPQGG